MRKELKLFLCMHVLATCMAKAQTPSVGIGTDNPNPKSILHLAAPQGNQGLLLPKLTTAQMEDNAFKNSLGETEKGLMAYDIDRSQMFAWDGSKWKSSATFSLPYIDSVENGPNQSNLFSLIYKGNSGNAVGIMFLENRDPNNGFSPLLIRTNSKIQGAADFIITNKENATNGLDVRHQGLGSAGSFVVSNTSSTVAALNATTNGVANSVAVRGQATNGGTGVAALSNGNTFISPALYAEQSGTGDVAGIFKLTNAGNPYNALFGESVGSGATFFALQKGTGRAGQFQINNTSNTEAALRGFTDGLGRAGFFTINNAANNADVFYATGNGSGNAVFAQNTGNGSAARFENTNEVSNKSAVEVFSKSKTANGLSVTLEGGNNGDAIFAQKTTGFGSAGNFQNQNAANEASILFAGTNAPGGSALGAGNFGNGNALAIWGGGLRLSTGSLSVGGNISTRNAAYEITSGSAYTISFPLSNGETFFFYNNTASPVTINSISIAANAGKTFIVLNGVLRGM
jgi:hypothetical protein